MQFAEPVVTVVFVVSVYTRSLLYFYDMGNVDVTFVTKLCTKDKPQHVQLAFCFH